mmetsp:Transcript_34571/g.114516  ORF Transcript_34571/g.114516 Transcript_34571/m.114516 type:complete len:344 (-) Transcript_34571:105-1136(-)
MGGVARRVCSAAAAAAAVRPARGAGLVAPAARRDADGRLRRRHLCRGEPLWPALVAVGDARPRASRDVTCEAPAPLLRRLRDRHGILARAEGGGGRRAASGGVAASVLILLGLLSVVRRTSQPTWRRRATLSSHTTRLGLRAASATEALLSTRGTAPRPRCLATWCATCARPSTLSSASPPPAARPLRSAAAARRPCARTRRWPTSCRWWTRRGSYSRATPSAGASRCMRPPSTLARPPWLPSLPSLPCAPTLSPARAAGCAASSRRTRCCRGSASLSARRTACRMTSTSCSAPSRRGPRCCTRRRATATPTRARWTPSSTASGGRASCSTPRPQPRAWGRPR